MLRQPCSVPGTYMGQLLLSGVHPRTAGSGRSFRAYVFARDSPFGCGTAGIQNSRSVINLIEPLIRTAEETSAASFVTGKCSNTSVERSKILDPLSAPRGGHCASTSALLNDGPLSFVPLLCYPLLCHIHTTLFHPTHQPRRGDC